MLKDWWPFTIIHGHRFYSINSVHCFTPLVSTFCYYEDSILSIHYVLKALLLTPIILIILSILTSYEYVFIDIIHCNLQFANEFQFPFYCVIYRILALLWNMKTLLLFYDYTFLNLSITHFLPQYTPLYLITLCFSHRNNKHVTNNAFSL